MANERLQHDCALAMAEALADLLGDCFGEEEKREAREEFYRVCRAGIEAYEIQHNRLRHRLNPTKN